MLSVCFVESTGELNPRGVAGKGDEEDKEGGGAEKKLNEMAYKGSLWRRGFQTIYKFGHRYFRLRGVHFCHQNLLNISATRVISSQTFRMVKLFHMKLQIGE